MKCQESGVQVSKPRSKSWSTVSKDKPSKGKANLLLYYFPWQIFAVLKCWLPYNGFLAHGHLQYDNCLQP